MASLEKPLVSKGEDGRFWVANDDFSVIVEADGSLRRGAPSVYELRDDFDKISDSEAAKVFQRVAAEVSSNPSLLRNAAQTSK